MKVYEAPPGMVFVPEDHYEEIESLRAQLAAEREARERLETGEAYATVSGNAVYWQKRAETAERERDEARQFGEMAAARYNELLKDKTLRCAFCGAEYPPGTPSFQHEALTHHVLHCVAHPMRAIEAERDEAVAELARVREAARPFATMARSTFYATEENEHYRIILCEPRVADFSGQDIFTLRDALGEG